MLTWNVLRVKTWVTYSVTVPNDRPVATAEPVAAVDGVEAVVAVSVAVEVAGTPPPPDNESLLHLLSTLSEVLML